MARKYRLSRFVAFFFFLFFAHCTYEERKRVLVCYLVHKHDKPHLCGVVIYETSVPPLGGTGPLIEPMPPSGPGPLRPTPNNTMGNGHRAQYIPVDDSPTSRPTTAVTLTDITAVPISHRQPAPAPTPHHHHEPSPTTRQQQRSRRLHNS